MKIFLVGIFFFIFHFSICAQQIDVYVNILDSATNKPLPFVAAYLKQTGKGGSTNFEGDLQLKSQLLYKNDTLICSYVGYKEERIAVELTSKVVLNIKMKPSEKVLDEFVVNYEKPLSSIQILKNVISKIKDNYSVNPVNLTAFYRESIKENEKYIQLNEAIVKFYYTGYPQDYDHAIWEDWYDDSYAFEFQGTSFTPPIHHFNTKKDKVKVVESRSSTSYGNFGIEPVITGGPLDLSALDMVKYEYDFLNPSNFGKYNYQLKDRETFKNRSCYVISFYPNEINRRMVFDLGKKLDRSIYVGKIYIDSKTFAVLRVEYQLAKNIDFGFYTPSIPLNYHVVLNYQERSGVYYLDDILVNRLQSVEYNPISSKALNNPIFYEFEQFLQIDSVVTDNIIEIKQDECLKHTGLTTIRYHELPYNKHYWDEYYLSEYPDLPLLVKQDLEQKELLNNQFSTRFQQKLNIPLPKAMEVNYSFNYGVEILNDNYQWLANPIFEKDILSYLNDENEYAKNYVIPFKKFQKRFFNAMDNFYRKDTTSIRNNYRKGDFAFKEDSLENRFLVEYTDSINNQIIFNYSEFEGKRANCFISSVTVNGNLICVNYTVDGGSNECLALVDKINQKLIDSIPGTSSYQWFNDTLLLYTRLNKSKRSANLFSHRIGTKSDLLLYTEKDSTFDLSISESNELLLLTSESKNENEIFIIDRKQLNPTLKLIEGRRENIKYSVFSELDKLYILTNENALNNKVCITDASNLSSKHWNEFIPHNKSVFIEDFIITNNYIVVKTYRKSFIEIKYRSLAGGKWTNIDLDSKIFDARIRELKDDKIAIEYSSPNTPNTIYQFDLRKEELLKKYQVKTNSDWSIKNVKVERVWAKSSDGAKVPITLVRSNYPQIKHKGLILKVYGAYGAIAGEDFSAEDIVLLNDGFTIAYAHVRGDGIMGNGWYLNGKLLNKENSFDDYIACAEYLIKKKYTTSNFLVGYGNSAGGLVLGVAANRRPELFNTVILDHPFLDVITTMMNDSLPLTTDEYKEWGAPHSDSIVYEYIKAYSPYQNIKKQAYPNMLLAAGFNDFQTPYWQIAKYVAKIRSNNAGNSTILLTTDFNGGHIGNTSGKEWLRELSFQYAFIYANLFGK